MAKETILLEYQLVQKGGDKVVSTVTEITEAWDKSGKAATAALSEKQIDSATEKLSKFNTEVEKTATGFTSAKSELRELEKVITSGKLQGQDLQKAVAQAAKLKDRIGDVRSEIGKLSSDTRIFDSFVEGGRGVAAAFSVAQGAAALFGEENKDLQKSILKVQGALALLTGAQELANIVTTKGGIATQAYGVALKVVEGIQKAFAISAAASWAVATAGLTVLVAGVALLINSFEDATDASIKLQEQEERRKKFGERFSSQLDAIKQLDDKNEIAFKKAKLRGEDLVKLEKRQTLERLSLITLLQKDVEYNRETNTIDEKTYSELSKKLEKERLDTLLSLRKDNAKKIVEVKLKQREDEKAIDDLDKYILPEQKRDLNVTQLTITPDEVVIEKVPTVEVPVKLKPLSPEETFTKFIDDTVEFLEEAKPFVTALSSFSSAFFQMETASLEREKQKQLALVGDNTKKREEIEKRFAIKQAEIARKQAIANKIFATFDIILNTAQGISKTIATSGFPAAIPLVALAAATGALQIAAVAAQPLPEIPKFAKGVIGFKGKGTETSDENLVMISNNESVMTGNATNKYRDELQAAQDLQLEDLIYHKYLLPALKQAGAADKEGNLYDDWLLRRTIKAGQQADKENSKYIVSGIINGIRETNYFNQRYFA